MSKAIVWFRRDLRLSDNPALHAACEAHEQVIPLYMHEPTQSQASSTGSASRVWLHHSLGSLARSISAEGNTLVLRAGEAAAVLQELIEQTGADAVYWNRCYEPDAIERDKRIKQRLCEQGIEVHSYNAGLIYEPWQVLKHNGEPYRVFTPFWKQVLKQGLLHTAPLPAPERIPPAGKRVKTASIAQLCLLPAQDWHRTMMKYWEVGEEAAHEKLLGFLDGPVGDYQQLRDFPAQAATSRLSAHLHFGEISPRQIAWQAQSGTRAEQAGTATFLKEVGWREFACHMLYHFPQTSQEPLDRRFKKFPWRKPPGKYLTAWQQGRTGIPIVDAGMRELWHSGSMHNRVRMIAASFLVKNCLVDWRLGERWFRDTLVDADLASNVFGWQWTAGCGADAAPYFRIFNPVLQGEKFDREGVYVKRWVPELKNCPSKYIHQPWNAPVEIRETLDYPPPIVDLKQSRERALDMYGKIR